MAKDLEIDHTSANHHSPPSRVASDADYARHRCLLRAIVLGNDAVSKRLPPTLLMAQRQSRVAPCATHQRLQTVRFIGRRYCIASVSTAS